MDLYISSLVLGAVGLGVMALSGLGHQGHVGHGHGDASHAGHGHGPHLDGHPAHLAHLGQAAHAAHAAGGKTAVRGTRGGVFWALVSPRLLFSLAFGFGAAGELIEPVFSGGPMRLAAAAVGAALFERMIFTPMWNLAMRFASRPALTLESAITDEATAVTAFDANGQGIVSVEVDGQIVQVLATLQPEDRSLGVRVRAGQRVRIEDVNAAASRCTVSLI